MLSVSSSLAVVSMRRRRNCFRSNEDAVMTLLSQPFEAVLDERNVANESPAEKFLFLYRIDFLLDAKTFAASFSFNDPFLDDLRLDSLFRESLVSEFVLAVLFFWNNCFPRVARFCFDSFASTPSDVEIVFGEGVTKRPRVFFTFVVSNFETFVLLSSS